MHEEQEERAERPSRRRAILLENIHPGAAERLAAAGFDVETFAGAHDERQLVDRMATVDLLGIRSRTRVTDAVLDQAPRLLAVGAFCIGTNQIDLAAATGGEWPSSTPPSPIPAAWWSWSSPRSSR